MTAHDTKKVVRLRRTSRPPGRTTKWCGKHKRNKRLYTDGKHYCPICENPWYQRLYDIIHKENRNALVVVEGSPGTGKSYFCLKVAEDLDPKFFENPGMTMELLGLRIIFKPTRFAQVLNEKKLYHGAVVIIEEGGVQADHRKWYSFNNMVFNYIFQTFRFMKLIVIVNIPVIKFLDSDAQKMFDYHVETINVNFREKQNYVKIKEQTYNSTTGKIYRKFLRYKVNNRFIAFKRPWGFPKAQKDLCSIYEKLHKFFKRGLIDELAREMATIDKLESVKKRKLLVNEEEAVAKIVANQARYVKIIRDRPVVDKALVEFDFQVGRGIGDRIKKRAELAIIEGQVGVDVVREDSAL